MGKWVRTAAGANPADDFSYINLDHALQAVVISVTGGYSVEFGGEASGDFGSIYGRRDTAAEAGAALQLLLAGVDLSATVGEQV